MCVKKKQFSIDNNVNETESIGVISRVWLNKCTFVEKKKERTFEPKRKAVKGCMTLAFANGCKQLPQRVLEIVNLGSSAVANTCERSASKIIATKSSIQDWRFRVGIRVGIAPKRRIFCKLQWLLNNSVYIYIYIWYVMSDVCIFVLCGIWVISHFLYVL